MTTKYLSVLALLALLFVPAAARAQDGKAVVAAATKAMGAENLNSSGWTHW